jgi:hypothetical protein
MTESLIEKLEALYTEASAGYDKVGTSYFEGAMDFSDRAVTLARKCPRGDVINPHVTQHVPDPQPDFDAMQKLLSPKRAGLDSLKYWLPYIEGHFEGTSDEHDIEIDKARAVVAAMQEGK